MRKILFLCCLAILATSVLLGGCSWMGRTAGKAQAKVERKIGSVEEGYHEGYSQEKAK